ncbi:MAG: SpoIIE family protein phosphatase [Methylibium sp.]|uniref:SpoIIE family protein phosphatase n=1 Tax=Methylibium sp. TaxID=2067992 RepID=UPI0018371D05|nr:SpoIIE family protein phosphatase [Methylibium sp.]MBA3596820.1 SpoIIE family protein phosphatase [Methylibium sp.]
MIPHFVIPVHEPNQVGEARRVAVRLAGELGFRDVAIGRVALIVTELGTNLHRHAVEGRLLIAGIQGPSGTSLEVLSLDRGPGMADMKECLRDGYSTGGTAGTGLGAVRRLAAQFSAFSSIGRGSVVLARVSDPSSLEAAARRPSRFEYAGIAIAAPNETVSGDAWGFSDQGACSTLMVADGLGHGPDAAEAADKAVQLLHGNLSGSPSLVLERTHQALRATRGAAVAVAQMNAEAGTITYCGAGNIAGRLISGVDDRSLLSHNGTIGLQVRKLHDTQYPWPEHAMLVLCSDGITTRWDLKDDPALLQCDPAVIAGWVMRDHCRGRDDATVVVVKRSE